MASSDSGARSLNLFLPASLVALFAITGLINSSAPLQSSRPQGSTEGFPRPPSTRSMASEFSRLWEDPLTAVSAVKPSKYEEKYLNDEIVLRKKMTRLLLSSRASTERELSKTEEKLHVLIVLMPGEPHADASERRRRIHYSVTTGLGVAGYYASYADRITYIQVKVGASLSAVNTRTNSVLRFPIKLFARGETNTKSAGYVQKSVVQTPDEEDGNRLQSSRILAVYINESAIGTRPLAAVSEILGKMFLSRTSLRVAGKTVPEVNEERIRQIRVSILGPTSSDTLLRMASELPRKVGSNEHPSWPWDRMALYNYCATIDTEDLLSDSAESNPIESSLVGRVEMVRTIGTDKQLIALLKNELKVRGAYDSEREDQHLVLLTENDTAYGRALRRQFLPDAVPGSKELETAEKLIHVYSYLRGVDGQAANPLRSIQTGSALKIPEKREVFLDLETELPEGGSQYDYIRRVALQVLQLQKELRATGKGEISAVGVMGTDVYDKLLVLRALRPRLPSAVYFTTDLDAVLSNANEYEYTRNLIVVSHFGQQLHKRLQRESPIFRDCYQTSCFLTTLMIAGDPKISEILANRRSELNLWSTSSSDSPGWNYLTPLVFEISRKGPFQLDDPNQPVRTAFEDGEELKTTELRSVSSLIHPQSDTVFVSDNWGQFLGFTIVGLISASAGLLIYWEGARRIFIPLVIVFLCISFVLWMLLWCGNKYGVLEPFTLLAGISVWPTVGLRVFASIAAVYLALAAVRKVRLSEFDGVVTSSGGEKGRLPKWLELLPQTGYATSSSNGLQIPSEQVYASKIRWQNVCIRVIPQVCLFCLFTFLLSFFGEPISRPARGYAANIADEFSFFTAIVTFIALCFVVLDLSECLRQYAKNLRRIVLARSEKLETEEIHLALLARHRQAIEKLASYSRSTSSLILYPSIVLLILIFSQLGIFDNWTFSWSLALPMCICASAAIIASLALRREVSKVRESVLRTIKRDRHVATRNAPDVLTDYDNAIEEVVAERRGAFRPWSEDPLVTAISLPFGGAGSVLLIEQWLRSVG